jgi:hypothetical protein
MVTKHDAAIEGAFLMDGLRDTVDYRAILNAWGHGYVGLVEELTLYAPLCWMLAEAGGELTGEFPGVYDYEVTSPFGLWFGEYVLDYGCVPPRTEATGWLVDAAFEFFTQVEATKEPLRARLVETVKTWESEQ